MKRFQSWGWKLGRDHKQSSTRPSSVMSQYQRWQQQFFYQRLRLLIGLILMVTVSVTLYEVCVSWIAPDKAEANDYVVNVLIGLPCVVALGLQTTRWGKRNPGAIFWGVSAMLTLMLLGQGVLSDGIHGDEVGLWTLIFLAQSTLVPVRWKLHLRSQLSLLIPLTVLIAIALLDTDAGTERQTLIIGTIPVYIYLIWVCIIADLSVYLYECLRYQEFEACQSVQTFLHAVSHDLRNPVTGSQLLLKSLLEQPGDKVAIPRVLLEQMRQSGAHQLALINSLLEAHKNNLSGIALQYQKVHLQSLVESVCQELDPLLQEAQVTVHNQFDSTLPPIDGDSTQLRRVFQNLIINALHHNPLGITVWIEVEVVASANSPHIYCTVRDNGVGMTPEQCAQLFNLYAQGTHLRRHLSVGLGLHIAQQIIQAHGGSIGVESTKGKGSQFWLMLPLQSGLFHPALPQG
ncbi:MAG: HAMP domain-containing sensor histidine kinase [Cyanobacteria bacterium J06559_3]